MSATFMPGSLVTARGREWVVEPSVDANLLRLRPLGGSSQEATVLLPSLEREPPRHAVFPLPDPSMAGSHDAARMLRDSLQLKLRSGAGPFRSFGNIAIEPRAYQLVPLLMALRQSVVRLLIADDVGIGKTIEAGLIARELYDRCEIERSAVLCPPHLVDQWCKELNGRFHLPAVGLTASSASRLERDLPQGKSVFDQHPFVVVSLDYIKSQRHRDHFLSTAPEFLIVDEAHTCTRTGGGRQLRFDLLRHLAASETRHLLLLTATPHSGDDEAFHNLLSLLAPEFAQLQGVRPEERKGLRDELSRHFVQRRRKDIDEWKENPLFPRRLVAEITYRLSGKWGEYFDHVQEYCQGLAGRTSSVLSWYATLALLRCVSSSPAAAVRALETRLGTGDDEDSSDEEELLLDGTAEELQENDVEPAARVEEHEILRSLVDEARSLLGIGGDPKLAALVKELRELVRDGFHPVVFCRYVATAEYVADELRKVFKDSAIDAVTGRYTSEEREERVASLVESGKSRILVATDCLSEGINLQHGFTAVVHYDLAWNPTRHEQREGRVDRFGQPSPTVKCALLYGQDNPVDGFVFKVILRKAREIQDKLGVLVPMPEDESRVRTALLKCALMKRSRAEALQTSLDFGLEVDIAPLETRWNDAMEKAKANRTVFAQRRLKPEDVLPDWRRQRDVLGCGDDVLRFLDSACLRLQVPFEILPHRSSARRLDLRSLPEDLRERLKLEGIEGRQCLDVSHPPHPAARFLHRTDPLIAALADHLLEGALSGAHTLAARSAAVVTDSVQRITRLYLLRLRHCLAWRRRGIARTLLAEETLAVALEGGEGTWMPEENAAKLLDVRATSNLGADATQAAIREALDKWDTRRADLETLARERAATLLSEHRRVREASRDVGEYSVTPSLPVDVVGVYVLLPEDL
ncbi:MAG: DEAD/DEAH box helicase [Fibrobacteria bacterium]|nr:DEAD/DEAH box helicase [Fibrobacteria bacterium]